MHDLSCLVMPRQRPLPDTWRGRLAQQIRAFRKDTAHISSPVALAKAANVGKQAIEHLETATGNPTAETLDSVLDALKADLQIAVVPRDDSSLDNPPQQGVKMVPSNVKEREKSEGASMDDDPDPRRDPDARAILGVYESFKRQVGGDERLIRELVRAMWSEADKLLDRHLERTETNMPQRKEAGKKS